KPASNATKQFTADDLLASSEAAVSEAAVSEAAVSEAAVSEAATGPLGQTDEAAEVTDGETTAPTAAIEPFDSPVKQAEPGSAPDARAPAASAPDDDSPGTGSGTDTKRDNRPDRRPPVTRSRIIRPASYPRF